MKLNIKVYSLLVLLCATSCTSYRKVPYFQVKGDPMEFETQSYFTKSEVRFQPDDILAITVNVPGDQKIAQDYNLPLQPVATSIEGDEGYVDQGIGRQTYLVSKNGDIDLPTLGLVKVIGYTQEELQDNIKKLLRSRSMKVDPVVIVRLMNFRIYVLGEVVRPGQLTINKDRIDLFEALSLAGDLTINGERDNVIIRRQLPDGKFNHIRLDISKADITTSPYFYLRQNDVIYVKPNKAKTLQSEISFWSTIMSVASFLMGVATFVAFTTSK